MFYGKIVVLLVLTAITILLTIGLPKELQAATCASEETFVNSAVAPNGNTLLVCHYELSDGKQGLHWLILDPGDNQLNSKYSNSRTFSASAVAPDSKILVVTRSKFAPIITEWYIYGAFGNELVALSDTGVLVAAITSNDSKFTIVTEDETSVSWRIYGGSSATFLNGNTETFASLISASTGADNKVTIVICRHFENTPDDEVTYVYNADGSLESSGVTGICQGKAVGGIAELPEISEFPLEKEESPGTNYTPYIATTIVIGIIIIATGFQHIRRQRL